MKRWVTNALMAIPAFCIVLAGCNAPQQSDEEKRAAMTERLLPATGDVVVVKHDWKQVLDINVEHPIFGGHIKDYRTYIKVATLGKRTDRGTECELDQTHALLGSAPGRTAKAEDPLPHAGIPIWFYTASRGNTMSPDLAKYLSFSSKANNKDNALLTFGFSNNGVNLSTLGRVRTWHANNECPAVIELCPNHKAENGNTCPGDRWESVDSVMAYPNTSKELKRVTIFRGNTEIMSAAK